jgi:hypothetical protein
LSFRQWVASLAEGKIMWHSGDVFNIGDWHMNKSVEQFISIPSTSHSRDGFGGITLSGLKPHEIDIVTGAFGGGHHWVRRSPSGRLESVPSYEALPPPQVDEKMHPFWLSWEECGGVQLELFPLPTARDYDQHTSPSILISSLCGYGYTPEKYKATADELVSYGFACLRSQRDAGTGQFWELWYLPSLWFARGDLREAIDTAKKKSEKRQTDVALEFLRTHVSFGSLDVAVQRLAMVIEPD